MNNLIINQDLIGRSVQWNDVSGYHEGTIVGVSAGADGRFYFLVNEKVVH